MAYVTVYTAAQTLYMVNKVKYNNYSRKTTDYTLVLADDGISIEMNSGSANIVTVPGNDSVPFPIGTKIQIIQRGAGETSIAPAVADAPTINSLGVGVGNRTSAGRYAKMYLEKYDTNAWYLSGDLIA